VAGTNTAQPELAKVGCCRVNPGQCTSGMSGVVAGQLGRVWAGADAARL
jgi:hypothetical protein